MVDLPTPYLLFLGDAPDVLAAKMAFGAARFRPDRCVGQLRLAECKVDLGLPEMNLDEAVAGGARALVVGVVVAGGRISSTWVRTLVGALEGGLDLIAGMHQRLSDFPEIAAAASKHGRQLFDIRHSTWTPVVGTGKKRRGKRLLTVGTDCSVGKMVTSLYLTDAMRARGIDATFRATGQTGILIAGEGIAVDAVVADFISGAAEALSPDAEDDHWDVVEGQGSLFHPSFSGVSLGLLHGSQPDALVLCHEPTREHLRGLPHRPLPALSECVAVHLASSRRANPAARMLGLSINTSGLGAAAAREALAEAAEETGLVAVDPMRTGVEALLERLR